MGIRGVHSYMDKKKLAIVTLYGNQNFGNKLQNYASQVYFEKKGFEVDTLDYYENFCRMHTFKNDTHKLAHLLLRCLGFEKERRKREERERKRYMCIKTFSDQLLNVAQIACSRRLPFDLKKRYDYFVAGSDQIWHCWQGTRRELEYFFLRFADRHQRITMSGSFGFREFPSKYLSLYKEGLEGFDHISCRENDAAELIKKLTGKDATVLLDPTLLIDTDEWEKILRRPSWLEKDGFVLLYVLGKGNVETENFIKNMKSQTNWDLLDVNDEESDIYTSTRPDEFLYCIKNANFVITDSFHASVFSIIFRVPFVVVPRSDVGGMEDRIDTLLDTFGLAQCKLDQCVKNGKAEKQSATNFDSFLGIDFECVDEILNTERKKASVFFEQCFENMHLDQIYENKRIQ